MGPGAAWVQQSYLFSWRDHLLIIGNHRSGVQGRIRSWLTHPPILLQAQPNAKPGTSQRTSTTVVSLKCAYSSHDIRTKIPMASRHAIDGLDDVWLFTTQEAGHGGQVSLLYEIEVARLSRVHFSIDFAGSVNFAVEALGGRRTRAAATSAGGPAAPAELFCVSVVAEPFARTAVGRLVLVDPTKPATLANSYAWALEPPDWQVLWVGSIMFSSFCLLARSAATSLDRVR